MSTNRPLTRRQQDVLFVVSQNAPMSVRDGYYHLPGFTEASIRSVLRGLENKSLVGRQYTGMGDGARIGYVLTDGGRQALAALDLDDDYDPAEDGAR